MQEHSLDIIYIMGGFISLLLIVLKGMLIWAFRHLVAQLDKIQISLADEGKRLHSLEIRVAKIEVRLGIANGEEVDSA